MRSIGTHLNQRGSRHIDQRQVGKSLSFFRNISVKGLKQALRFRIREKRLHLPLRLQQSFSSRIAIRVLQSHDFRVATSIAFYSASFGEVSTKLLLSYALSHQKACYLPVLQNNKLVFAKVTASSILQPNRFGILEPSLKSEKIISPQALDLVLMPLVAFDSQCNRLGMGGGFYDRTFHFKQSAHAKPKLVGLAYEFQHVEQVPSSNLDVFLDSVVTEKKRYRAKN